MDRPLHVNTRNFIIVHVVNHTFLKNDIDNTHNKKVPVSVSSATFLRSMSIF